MNTVSAVKFRHVVAVSMGALSVAACTGVAEPLPDIPSTLALRASAPTTRRQNVAQLSIPPLEGSTTTTRISFARGSVTVSGFVSGPDGPVDGATVLLERVVGEQTVQMKVQANADGRYKVSNIKGGVLRVSAFKVPDLASTKAKVVFASEATEINLEVDNSTGTDVQWALGPAVPLVGRPSTLVIRISVKRVDPDGVVRFAPLEGVGVRVVAQQALQPNGVNEKVTDGKGLVSFSMLCSVAGYAGINVLLATGEETKIEPRQCTVPATTAPPEADPPTTVPPTGPDGSTLFPPAPPPTRRVVRRTTTIAPPVVPDAGPTNPPVPVPPPDDPPPTQPLPVEPVPPQPVPVP